MSEQRAYTPDRVDEALQGRVDRDALSAEEQDLYDLLLRDRFLHPPAAAAETMRRIGDEAGAVGYDTQDRLVRRLPDGSLKVLEG